MLGVLTHPFYLLSKPDSPSVKTVAKLQHFSHTAKFLRKKRTLFFVFPKKREEAHDKVARTPRVPTPLGIHLLHRFAQLTNCASLYLATYDTLPDPAPAANHADIVLFLYLTYVVCISLYTGSLYIPSISAITLLGLPALSTSVQKSTRSL